MKICVTGGSGMVGKCIKDLLDSEKNIDVIYLGNTSREKYITRLDLKNKDAVIKFFEKEKFDYVIHLAAKVGGLYKNMRDNIGMFNDNIQINQNVLDACNQSNVNRGIFCLSSCIYPHNPSKFPMDESMIHESPPHYSNEGYAYAKRMLEMLCRQYNIIYNREYICVIPVNLYGPYDNFSLEDGHFIPMIMNRFFKQIKSNDYPLQAYGSGLPLRQFLYAPDFGKIILEILLSDKYRDTSPLICCNNDEYTIKDVVNEIGIVLNIDENKISWDKSKSDGCMRKTVTNKKFSQIFPDFEFTSLKCGLNLTYKWFIENYSQIRED